MSNIDVTTKASNVAPGPIKGLGHQIPVQNNIAVTSSAELHLSLVTSRAEFYALEDQWNALFERAGRPYQLFQSFHWLWHWANHYVDDHTILSIVCGRKDGRLTLVWPLIERNVAGWRQLLWMGEPVSQYGDVLIEDGAEALDLLQQSWAWVKSLNADLIYLRKTRSDAMVAPIVAQASAISTSSTIAPYVDFSKMGGVEIHAKRNSAKQRSTRRRLFRRLSERGSVAFEQHRQGPDAKKLVNHALALKRAWLRQRRTMFTPLQDSRFVAFFGDVALDRTHPAGARISAVRCDGEPAAIDISFECKGHVFGHIISSNLKFEKQGAGVLIADYSIRTAYEQGCIRFDMLAPADPYKMDWADATIEINDWAIPLSIAGKLYAHAWLGAGREWIKVAAKGLPPWLARMLATIYWRIAKTPLT